jgi:hypothetical protein
VKFLNVSAVLLNRFGLLADILLFLSALLLLIDIAPLDLLQAAAFIG